jgi:melibiose permease
MAFYYVAYDIGDQGLFMPFIAFGGVMQLVGVATYSFLSKKLNRKQIYNLSILIQVFAFVALFLNAFIFGNMLWLVFASGAFVFYGQGLSMVLQTVLLSDTVEYGELKTGRRSEAVVFSVQTFIVKLATGLSMGFVGVGLAIFQFKSDPNASELLPQSDLTIWGIRIMMFILPVFGMLIARHIFNKKHIINEEKYAEIVEELKVIRGKDANNQS